MESPEAAPTLETPKTEDSYESRTRRRLRETYAVLTKDSLTETYEAEPVRKIIHRLELLENGELPDDEEQVVDIARRIEILKAELDRLHATQKDDLGADNPK